MKICPYCSGSMDDSAMFCPKCGAPAEDTSDEVKFEADETQSQSQSQTNGQPLYTQASNSQTAQPQGTNPFAVAGFVLSFFVAILGLIFCAIALKQIPERNEGGHGLAIAGLVLSIISIGLWLILLSTGACALNSLRFYI